MLNCEDDSKKVLYLSSYMDQYGFRSLWKFSVYVFEIMMEANQVSLSVALGSPTPSGILKFILFYPHSFIFVPIFTSLNSLCGNGDDGGGRRWRQRRCCRDDDNAMERRYIVVLFRGIGYIIIIHANKKLFFFKRQILRRYAS